MRDKHGIKTGKRIDRALDQILVHAEVVHIGHRIIDFAAAADAQILRDRRQFPRITSNQKQPVAVSGKQLGGFLGDRRGCADNQNFSHSVPLPLV